MSEMPDPNDAYRRPNRPPTVAWDFDGCLTEWAYPDCGDPRADEIDALRQLAEEGWWVIIHTSRVNSHWVEPDRSIKVAEMLAWLIKHEVPFEHVWGVDIGWHEGPKPKEWANLWHWMPAAPGSDYDWLCWKFNDETGKPVADIYRDDRADGHCACHYDAWVKNEAIERIVARARLLAGIEGPTESE